MKRKSKEIKIGISFIVALFIFYFGINFLKGINIFKPANSYVAVFEDVSGMLQADPITVKGMRVGQVMSMNLDPENKNSVLVFVEMEKDIRVPRGSKLSLDASMLGGSTILLEYPETITDYYVPGDTIKGKKKIGSMDVVTKAIPKIEILIPKLDSIMSGINKLINNPSLGNTLDNINDISKDLKQTSKEMNKLLAAVNKDFPEMSNNLGKTLDNFQIVSHQIKSIDLVSSANKFDSTMTNIQHLSSKLASKDSSLGLLLNDRAMYDSLNIAVGNASLLLRDVKENPSRYINVKVF